jgi:diacylglycerol kinase (ATP)
MKARLIVNPVSGTDTGPDHLLLINKRLRSWVGLMDIVMTVGEGDATQAAAAAARDGYDYVFAAGGDGTLNEVLNGIASVPQGLERVVFGIIPLGTGNDFANALGFSEQVDAALEQLVTSEVVPVDVGLLNGRYFFNVSGGGFIAAVSDAVDTQLKSVAGKLAYLIGGAQVLFSHEAIDAAMTWRGREAERGERRLPIHAFAVCNSQQIGGGRLIAPHAIIDDGLLDVCLIEAMPTLEFVALLRRVATGDHVEDERVTYFRASEIHMRFDREIKVNTDGQVLDARECHYRVLPRAARLLAPVRPG